LRTAFRDGFANILRDGAGSNDENFPAPEIISDLANIREESVDVRIVTNQFAVRFYDRVDISEEFGILSQLVNIVDDFFLKRRRNIYAL
jgi:hypothetical protein